MKNKAVYIIAGPNGSGKTTFAKLFLPDYVNCPNFLNADLIAHKEIANEELFKLVLKSMR